MHGILRLAALSIVDELRLPYSSFAKLNNSLRFPLRSNDAVFNGLDALPFIYKIYKTSATEFTLSRICRSFRQNQF